MILMTIFGRAPFVRMVFYLPDITIRALMSSGKSTGHRQTRDTDF
jgi:hypothetical protein